MARNLTNDDDVDQSVASHEREQFGNTIKLKVGKTPIYLLNSRYADGYAHWVNADGQTARVVCGGGLEGKGWAADECPLCKHVQGLYKKAKGYEAKEGKDGSNVTRLRKVASRARAKYEAHFLVAVGELLKEKRPDGKKVYVPDFEDGSVGVLSLSKTAFDDLVGLRNTEKYPFMQGAKDLTNRVLVADKAQRDGSEFATLEFIPSKNKADKPAIEYDEDDFDLDSDFEIDHERLDSLAELLGDGDDDADLDDEDDEEDAPKPKKTKTSVAKSADKPKKKSAAEVEDDFLDDVDDEDDEDGDDEEEEEAPPAKKPKKKPAPVVEDDDDDDEDEEFEDDDVDEEPAPKKVKAPAKPAPKTTVKKVPRK